MLLKRTPWVLPVEVHAPDGSGAPEWMNRRTFANLGLKQSVAALVSLCALNATAQENPVEGSGDGRSKGLSHPSIAQRDPVEVVIRDDERSIRGPSRDPSAPGAVLSRDRLEAPMLQAHEALRNQPGVIVTETGGIASPATATIRGASSADTPVYLGGVRLNDEVSGTADLSMIPLWLVQRVEVYRGHAPLEADRYQPGGAIFFEPLAPRKPQAGVGTSVGSWGSNAAYAFAGATHQRLGYLIGVSGTRASNRYPYEHDEGLRLSGGETHRATRENADVSRLDGWALGRYELGGAAYLQLTANVVDRERGVPRLALLPSRRARQRSTRQLVALSARLPINAHAVLDAQTSVLLGNESYQDPLDELSLHTSALTVSGRRLEQSVAARVELSPHWRIRPSLLVAEDTLQRTPSNALLEHTRRVSGRAALRAETDLSDVWQLHTLLSTECHLTDADRSNCAQAYGTGRFGTEIAAGPVRVYASAGRYVRIPTLGELFGVSGTVHGNRDLQAETGLSADLGLRAEARFTSLVRRAYFDAFTFVRDADRLIAYSRTGQGFIRPYNVGRARVMGAEVLTGIALLQFLHLETALTLLDPRDRTPDRHVTNDLLPYRSRLFFGPRIRADWRWYSRDALSSFGAEVSALHQSSRYADRAGLAIIDAQTSVDANAYLGWFDDMLHLRLRIADLFDQERTDLIGYPLPRRSVYFGLDARF